MIILTGGGYTSPNPEIPGTMTYCPLRDVEFIRALLRHVPTGRLLLMGNGAEQQIAEDPEVNRQKAYSEALNAVLGVCVKCPNRAQHDPKSYAARDLKYPTKFVPVVSVNA